MEANGNIYVFVGLVLDVWELMDVNGNIVLNVFLGLWWMQVNSVLDMIMYEHLGVGCGFGAVLWVYNEYKSMERTHTYNASQWITLRGIQNTTFVVFFSKLFLHLDVFLLVYYFTFLGVSSMFDFCPPHSDQFLKLTFELNLEIFPQSVRKVLGSYQKHFRTATART